MSKNSNLSPHSNNYSVPSSYSPKKKDNPNKMKIFIFQMRRLSYFSYTIVVFYRWISRNIKQWHLYVSLVCLCNDLFSFSHTYLLFLLLVMFRLAILCTVTLILQFFTKENSSIFIFGRGKEWNGIEKLGN